MQFFKLHFFSLFLLIFFSGCDYNLPPQELLKGNVNGYARIKILSKDVINETALGNPGDMFDEQLDFNGTYTIGIPETQWHPPAYAPFYPLHSIIELNTGSFLECIYFYTDHNSKNFTVETGGPNHWKEVNKNQNPAAKGWNKIIIKDSTNCLRISLLAGAAPAEFIVFGKTSDTTDKLSYEENSAAPKVKIKMKDLVGTNAFVDDPMEATEIFKLIREYHSWSWDEGNQYPFGKGDDKSYKGFPNNKNKFEPSYAGNWKFDSYYTSQKHCSTLVCPAMSGGVDWITDDPAHKPIYNNADPLLPTSYIAHADHIFQYMARYGNNILKNGTLKLHESQPVMSGLRLLSYMENWNEPDAWWMGREAYFTPYEYAAMSSADYDGHQYSIKANIGLKLADTSARMVMAGLSTLNLSYLKAIQSWCNINRNGKLPFDVLNFHHYSNASYPDNTIGISPEEDSLQQKLTAFKAYCDSFFPGKEVWLSEFGFDSDPRSPQGVPRNNRYSYEDVQAQWILRSYLAIAAAGIDKCMMYMLRDVDSKSANKYSTCGVTKDKNSNWQKKTAWYFVSTFTSLLGEMHFVRLIKYTNVWVCDFENEVTQQKASVVWCPTSTGMQVAKFKLPCNTKSSKVIVTQLAKGHPGGIQHFVPVNSGMVNLTVDEQPQIILF